VDVVTQIPTLPDREANSHKGTYGHALIIAGSRGMSGAAVLSGSAALRGGAGLVTVAVPGEIGSIVCCGNPCYTTAWLGQDLRGRFAAGAIDELVDVAQNKSVVAIGPGIGNSEANPRLLAGLLARIDKPVIIDADGLNALAKISTSDWPTRADQPTIVTPHPGEFSRMIGQPTAAVQENREELAIRYATEKKVIVVLKGHQTIVTDGKQLYRNPTGNAGMATGGTGDVLTGLMAGLLAQELNPFEAALLAVWVHGRAGDHAAKKVGMTALIASDLLDHLPHALREVGG
jgi:ADP-dependent NAD(P)H-hydrate dehydratase